MIQITPKTAGNLIIAIAHGKVTGEDYERVLIPAVEGVLMAHPRVRMLYQLASDFDGFTASAIWDDAKLSFAHMSAFEAVAVVTDVHWITDSVRFFAFFLHCPVKAFRNDQILDATEWVATVPAWRSLAAA
jgi:hypothetical protein